MDYIQSNRAIRALRITFRALFCCVTLGFSCASAQTQIMTQSTKGDCSPIVITNGNVHISCTDKQIEARVIDALNAAVLPLQRKLSITQDAAAINAHEVRLVRRDQSRVTETLNRIDESNTRVAGQLEQIATESSRLEKDLSARLAGIQDEFGLSIEFTSNLMRQVRKDLEGQVDLVRVRVESTEQRIGIVRGQIESMKQDVAYIMNQFARGNLQSNMYFFGLGIRYGKISNASTNASAIEMEALTTTGVGPLSNTSIYASLARLSSSKKLYFVTQNGSPPLQLTDDNSGTELALGMRRFQPSQSPSWNWFLGGAITYFLPNQAEVGRTAGAEMSIGIERATRNSRIAIESGIRSQKIATSNFRFNPAGNSELSRSTTTGWSGFIGLRASFH